jgi:hypothetical protein
MHGSAWCSKQKKIFLGFCFTQDLKQNPAYCVRGKKKKKRVTPEFGERRKEKIQLQKFGALHHGVGPACCQTAPTLPRIAHFARVLGEDPMHSPSSPGTLIHSLSALALTQPAAPPPSVDSSFRRRAGLLPLPWQR